MKISSTSAQQIVEEIGKLVRQNINLMDETGHIIASNDPGRIGKFHPGAFDVLTNHLTELYITQEWELSDNRVRQGINLPIEVDGHPEGVIGITGLYEEVIQYGQIVKKMAEILIRERIALDAQRLDQRIRTRFLEEWILGDGLANLQSLSERGVALGIDIRLSRRCVVVSPQNLAGYQNSLEGQSFLEQVESVVSAQLPQGAMVLRNTGRQVLILPASSSRELIRLCQKITDAVSKQLGIQMVCGIDGNSQRFSPGPAGLALCLSRGQTHRGIRFPPCGTGSGPYPQRPQGRLSAEGISRVQHIPDPGIYFPSGCLVYGRRLRHHRCRFSVYSQKHTAVPSEAAG